MVRILVQLHQLVSLQPVDVEGTEICSAYSRANNKASAYKSPHDECYILPFLCDSDVAPRAV